MYFDFGAKEIPSSAIRAVGSSWPQADSCVEQGCAPIFGGSSCGVNPETGVEFCSDDYVYKGCDCSNQQDPSGGGGGSTGGGTGMPQYNPNPNIPVACDEFVLCADGSIEQACGQTFAALCTGRGGVYDPNIVYKPDVVESNNPCEGVRCIRVYKPCPEGYIDVSECCPNTGDCVLDPDYVIPNVGLVQMQPISETAPVNFTGDPTTYRSGVMVDSPASQFDQTTPAAIALQDYRTQFEQAVQSGAVDNQPLPDFNDRYDVFVKNNPPPKCPTGYTAEVQDCMSGCFWMCLDSSGRSPDAPRDTPLPTERVQPDYSRVPLNPVSFETTPTPTTETPTTETPTTETSTAEEPKQSGLGILVLGLIALEALAT